MRGLEQIRFGVAEAAGGAASASEAAAAAAHLVDEVVAEAPGRGAHACQRHCAACCHLLVRVKPAEAGLVADTVLQGLALDALAALRGRLDRGASAARGLDAGAYRRGRLRCAFLDDDDLCSVYAVRPLKCRVHASSNVAACEDPLAPVPLDTWLVKVGEAAVVGLGDADEEELHQAVLARLPEATSGA